MGAQLLLLMLASYDVEIVRAPAATQYEVTVVRAEKKAEKAAPLPAIEKPTQVESKLHSHTCPTCKIRWYHGNEPGVFVSHNCPKCGALRTEIDQPEKPVVAE
jgi:hypothetical protein